MQRFRIRVAKLELDMLAMALHGFAANAKFFRDLTDAVPSGNESEHRHLAITEDMQAVGKFAPANLCMATEVIARLA